MLVTNLIGCTYSKGFLRLQILLTSYVIMVEGIVCIAASMPPHKQRLPPPPPLLKVTTLLFVYKFFLSLNVSDFSLFLI